jgi:putative spermidine/putrescine transport system permease protein
VPGRARTWRRFVTLPSLRTALLAGALLAFALSFDEVIVTTFTVILLSMLPVYLAQRLSSGGVSSGFSGAG